MVIDMSQGTPDHAWPADPYWRDKIRIAKQARELGQALRTGLPTSFRPACRDAGFDRADVSKTFLALINADRIELSAPR
ncbi:hypothetical protein QDT91_29705 (plasmid) [Mycolicibacterium aubagnense]|uniref:hypothetical protein n=1 Tax=Mycolicibacterium aubagnense TaxID=319707 RepID=UPI00244E35CA|nr:hypothetical protein [Mycolicibacterium aubagnense]WGI36194.1 hypothetical protein QDT91_29705 [Mycolicibacterium aubagnense]